MRKLTLSAAALLLMACGTKNDAADRAAADSTMGAMAPAPAATTPAPAAGPTDPQIAAIVVAANNVDIEAGKLAESKASNAKVKAFGKQMVTDHSAVNKQATALVTKLAVTPEENETSRSLTSGGEQNRSSLQGKTGKDFDKAYIDNEVAYHQQVLDAIDKTLIPNAQNAELKTLLTQTRPAIAAHLKMAQDIQKSL
jgi:putative membrane protein